MKNIIVTLTTAALILPALISPVDENRNNEEIYNKLAIVQDLDIELDEVVTVDSMGNIYAFSPIEDWFIGDMVILTMSDNRTDGNIYDDYILTATYQGHISQFLE